MNIGKVITLTTINLLIVSMVGFSQKKSTIVHDRVLKTVTLSDSSNNLSIQLNYTNGCVLDKMMVNGYEVIGSGNVVYSGVKLGTQSFSSRKCMVPPVITITNNTVKVSDIKYGDSSFAINEEWTFNVNKGDIGWQIKREYLNNGVIEENDLPCWQFNSMKVWDGAILDNGGVAWNRLLNEPGETYGTHASTLTFWNSASNACLRITPHHGEKLYRTAIFSHKKNNVLSVVQTSSDKPITTRFGLRRFLHTDQHVFAPVNVAKSTKIIQYTLQAFNYDQLYDRGTLKGVDEEAVNEMLNTIGRYGVVDRNLFGSNGWRTGYVVLQEPWLALLGLAIDSREFINGYSKTLEYEKGHAILPNGRVLPRWHYDSSDAMRGTFQSDGFYECQWGYMLDAQPAYAIDVAEQFDLTGNVHWLRQFKPTCEKVLGYMIDKHLNRNGLFTVVQDTYRDHKGCDWMDVVWASNEVASINAYMYKALMRWSALEKLLDDESMSENYRRLATRLKAAFNKDISDGGFWNPDKKWYVYWREKDGSVYGDNFVSSVNFLAIGYGLCDDRGRKAVILSRMEELMQKEKLFIWPSCFFPYKAGVGLKNVNYPFPNYENGDLFLAWAGLGTRCYAGYNPKIAVKYIHNVINRYKLDGLAHQRYTRVKQTGAGDDILSNNIMAIVGLYRNIYGIQPKYNRLYLEPHLTKELNGTEINYWLRNQSYKIDLTKDRYTIKTRRFTISSGKPFGISFLENELQYFDRDNGTFSLLVSTKQPCSIDIVHWAANSMHWKETTKGQKTVITNEVHHLHPHGIYQVSINDILLKPLAADNKGTIHFDCPAGSKGAEIEIVYKNHS